jgi:hypothetical protein
MNKNNSLITLLFGLVLFSCNKDKELNRESEPEFVYSIVGEWEWYSSYFYGEEHLPENTGIDLSLTFVKNDSLIVIENSDTVFKAEYFIKKEIDDYGDEIDVLYLNSDTTFSTEPTVFIIGPGFDRYIIRHLTDTLTLKEYYYIDGFHSFKRKMK